MLSNMFDPINEREPNWDQEISDDVIDECNKHGGVMHIYVDKASPQGNVYVKCPNIQTAVAAVNALHGRWFAGKVITAAYVPVTNYHNLFPESEKGAVSYSSDDSGRLRRNVNICRTFNVFYLSRCIPFCFTVGGCFHKTTTILSTDFFPVQPFN